MRFQHLVFRTTPHQLVEWFDGELEKRGIDSAYTHCILSILQEDHQDNEPDECAEVKNHQLRVIKKYGRPESLYSAAKPKYQKWKIYDKQILLPTSSPRCDISISDLERKKRNAAVSCLKSVSDDITIDDLIDELCLRLNNLKTVNERKHSVQSHNSDKETSFYIPPSSPTDQVEKYFAAFPPLEKQSEEKSNLCVTVNSNAWSGSYISTNKMSEQNIVQNNNVRYFEKRENFKNVTNSYGSLKSIENIYVPNSIVTENIAKKTNSVNKHGNNFQIESCDENTYNFSAIRKSGSKLNPFIYDVNLNKDNVLDSHKNIENVCSVISTTKSAFEKPKPCQTLNNICPGYNSHKAELNSAQKIKILSSSTYQLVTSRNNRNKNSDFKSISGANLFMPIKEGIFLNPILDFPHNAEKHEICDAEKTENKSFKCPFKEPVLQGRKEVEEMKTIFVKNNFIVLKIDCISNGRNKISSSKVTSLYPNVPSEINILESKQNVNCDYKSNLGLSKEDNIKKGKIIECNNGVVAYLKSINGFKRIYAPHFMKFTLNIPGKPFKIKFLDHNFNKLFLLVFEKVPCDVSKSIMKIIEIIQFVNQIKHKSLVSCTQLLSVTSVFRKLKGSYKIGKTAFAMKTKKASKVSKNISKIRAKKSKAESNKFCSASLNMSEKCSFADFIVENNFLNICNEDRSLFILSPEKCKVTAENSTIISSKCVTLTAKLSGLKQPYDDTNKWAQVLRNYEDFNFKERNATSEMENIQRNINVLSSLKCSDDLKDCGYIFSFSIFTSPSISTPYLKDEFANFRININKEKIFINSKEYHNIETVVFASSVCTCLCTNTDKELLFYGECKTTGINFCIYSSEMIEDSNFKPNLELPMSLKYLATLHLMFGLSLVNVLKITNFNLDLIHMLDKSDLNENTISEIIATGDLIDVKYLIDLFSSLGYFNHNLSLSVGMNISDGEINSFVLPNKKAFRPKYCMKQCINNSSNGFKSYCEMEYFYSSKLFLCSSKLFDNLKKKRIIASFSIPSYPLIASYNLKHEDTNDAGNDINAEIYFVDSKGLSFNNAPIYSQQSGMNTEQFVPWTIFTDLTENLDYDESRKLYSCDSFAQNQPLNSQNPASQVFSWKYPNFTDSYIKKYDVRLKNHSDDDDLKPPSDLIHKDSFHDKIFYQHFPPLIDNQNIQYFANPSYTDIENKIGTIFPSKSVDIKGSDNFEALSNNHEFVKPYLSPSNNPKTENFAPSPCLPLCFPSAFKPYKRCNYEMPNKINFNSSGQKLLKKAINIDHIIKEVASKDKVAFFETILTFSEPDKIIYPPLTLEQTSDPSYNDAKNKELNSFFNFENPLWSVDCVKPSSGWSNQYNFKSIWSDKSDSIDCIWKNDAISSENNESCYALSDYSNPYAICNDSKNEDDSLRGLFSLPNLKVEADIAYEKDNYIQSSESCNIISEQSVSISNLSTLDILSSDQAVSNISASNKDIYSLSVPHNDLVGFFCLDNCKNDDVLTETDYLNTDYSSRVETQAYQALDFTDLSAFRGPYGSYNEYGINYMEGGGWSLNSDSCIYESVDSQDSSFLQEMNPTESETEKFDNMQLDVMQDSFEDEEIAKYAARKSHTGLASSRRPCLFYMKGSCIHHHCMYNHDLSSTTCRFWIRGSCFKGATCPFLHGFVKRKVVDQHQIVKESKLENVENAYSLDSEADFPSLSSLKYGMPGSKSQPVNIEHIKVSKHSRQKSHQ